MKFSYEGIGAWNATFACDGAEEGQVVKLSASDTAAPCDSADAFCGVCISVRGDVCAVQLGGLVQVAYSGAAPGVGETTLTADGEGGVCAAENGQTCLVVSVDTAAGTCVIRL